MLIGGRDVVAHTLRPLFILFIENLYIPLQKVCKRKELIYDFL